MPWSSSSIGIPILLEDHGRLLDRLVVTLPQLAGRDQNVHAYQRRLGHGLERQVCDRTADNVQQMSIEAHWAARSWGQGLRYRIIT